MTIVRKIDGAWQPVAGVVTLARMVASRVVIYHDGRREEEACEPYPVAEEIDIGKAERLLADGVWSDADLAAYGLRAALPFAVPDGQRVIGEPAYVESKGAVREVFEVEDIPPPPPAPTPVEKLAVAGLTVEDFDVLFADALARREAP